MSAIQSAVASLLTPLIVSKSTPKIRIEDWTFRLHYRVTTVILLMFSALLCMREYIGANIKCSPNHDDDSTDPTVQRKIIETYCFIQTTFTIPPNYENTETRVLVRDTLLGGPAYVEGTSERVHHAYYQWVPFFLFFQAFLFYAPHFVWKSVESKKIHNLVNSMNLQTPLLKGEKKDHQVKSVASYLVKSKGTHGYWAFAFVLCELGNLAIVLGNMYLTDLFLGKEFSTYGPRVIQFLEQDPENREDPMASVFPRVTKCLFHTFGPSGTVQRLDALCILPSNILNEKIFTFLWFWFVFLAAITLFAFIYRLATLCSARIRCNALKIDAFQGSSHEVSVVKRLGLSEWFLLHLLRLNVNQKTFHILLTQMHEELI